MKKLKEFLKKNTDAIIAGLTVMLCGYFVCIYMLLKYIVNHRG